MNTEAVYQKIVKLEQSAKGNIDDAALMQTVKGIYYSRIGSGDLAEHYLKSIAENPKVSDNLRDKAYVATTNKDTGK